MEILVVQFQVRQYRMSHRYWDNFYDLYSGTWTCNWEPGPVLGNLDLYSGTWTRTRELPVLVYVLRFPSTTH